MKDKQRLKEYARAIGWGFFAMSVIESWHFFSWFFNGGTWQDFVYSLVSAPLINFVEVLCFAVWYHFRGAHMFIAWPAFVFGVLFGSVSVMGSLGWVGVKYDLNFKSSADYQRIQKQQESYQKLADGWNTEAEDRTNNKKGRGAVYAKEQAASAQNLANEAADQLAGMKGGGGGGNALFDMLAEFWDTTAKKTANIAAVGYSFIKEAAMVFLLLFSIMQESDKKNVPDLVPENDENDKKKRSRERKNGDSENDENDKKNVRKPVKKNGKMNVPDIDPASAVYQETKRLLLDEWVPGRMSLQKIADKVKRGKTYVFKVKEMENISR